MINDWNIDPNLKDERGATLIMTAFEHASLNTVPLLRQLGAITSDDGYGREPIKDNAGNTIAYYAVFGGLNAFRFGLHSPDGRGYFGLGIRCCADGRKPEDVARDLGEQDIVGYNEWRKMYDTDDTEDYIEWRKMQGREGDIDYQSIVDYIRWEKMQNKQGIEEYIEWRKMQGKQNIVNYQNITDYIEWREIPRFRCQLRWS